MPFLLHPFEQRGSARHDRFEDLATVREDSSQYSAVARRTPPSVGLEVRLLPIYRKMLSLFGEVQRLN